MQNLAAGREHDIRNHLGTIRCAAEVLGRQAVLSDRDQRVVQLIIEGADGLAAELLERRGGACGVDVAHPG